MILGYLSILKIKMLRLLHPTWAEAGSNFLFKPFVFRRHRPDLERLRDISKQCPHLLTHVTDAKFEIGTIDLHNLSYNLDHCLTLLAKEVKAGLNDRNPKLEGTRAIHEYSLRSAHWDQTTVRRRVADYNHRPNLEWALSKFPNLQHINIVLKACNFRNRILADSYLLGSGNDRHDMAIGEFEAILLAILATAKRRNKRIISLRHDEVPITFFALESERFARATNAFKGLETLHLSLDAIESPTLFCWKQLGLCLTAIPKLKNLRVGFDPACDARYPARRAYWGTWIDGTKGWLFPLWKALGGHVWPELNTLRFDGLLLRENDLVDLVRRHQKSLRDLQLCGLGLWEGSLKSCLLRIRDLGFLESFNLWGRVIAFHMYYSEEVVIEPSEHINSLMTDDYHLIYIHGKYYQPPFMATSQVFADFVLNNGLWVESSQPADEDILHNENCQDCLNYSEVEEGWTHTSREDGAPEWGTTWYAEYLTNIGEDSRLGIEAPLFMRNVLYNDGYDASGFDQDGFNRDGIHLRDMDKRHPRREVGSSYLERIIIEAVNTQEAHHRKTRRWPKTGLRIEIKELFGDDLVETEVRRSDLAAWTPARTPQISWGLN